MSVEDPKSDFSRESEPARELTVRVLVMGYPEIHVD